METSRCVCRITARVARLPCGVTAPQRYVCTLSRSPISPLLVSKQYSSIASLSTHRLLHTTATTQSWLEARSKDADKKEKELIVHQENIFDEVAKKAQNKETFKAAIAKYLRVQGVYRRGHVEFIYAALNKMSMFGVQRELSIYKALVDLFPKEKMVPNNAWQVEMMHYPKQQQCCIDILEKMEFNGVIPDDEMGRQLASIFGHKAHAFRKYRRMMYWMPKFKYANPYFVPRDIPTDPIELAVMALKRMAVDLQNDIIVHKLYDDVSFYIQSIEYDTAVDRTFIASAQSPGQQTLVADHPAESPVYVEGGFKVWLREKCLTYFVLRSDVTQTFTTFQQNQEQEEEESGSLINWSIFADDAEKPSPLVKVPTSHEQEDGTILATCITGTGSKDSVTTWVKLLEETNPRLSKLPVVFLLKTEDAAIQVWTEADEKNKQMSQELK